MTSIAPILITAPMVITSRLTPGLMIGEVCLSVCPATDDGQRVTFDAVISGPGIAEHHTTLTASWIGDDDISTLTRNVMSCLLSFLSEAADRARSAASRGETYGAPGVTDPETVTGDPLFPLDICQWALTHADEISAMACEFDADDDSEDC